MITFLAPPGSKQTAYTIKKRTTNEHKNYKNSKEHRWTRPKRIKMSDEATTSEAFITSAAATPLPPRPPASGGRVKMVKIYHQKDNTADQQPTVDDWSNSPILLLDTEEVMPSNQMVIKQEPEEEEDNSDSEFEQLSFLTQYIGPRNRPKETDRAGKKHK